MRHVGIFSGSFNPIHMGHLMLANWMCEYGGVDELWFVVTPRNPLKSEYVLLDDAFRLEMTRAAVGDYPRFRVSDVEFGLPRPSYTIHTLRTLRDIRLRRPRDPSHVLNKRRFTEEKTYGVEAFKLLAQLSKSKEAEVRADDRQFCLVVEGGPQGVSQAFALGVVENLHGPYPSPSCRDSH